MSKNSESTAVAQRGTFSLSPSNITEAMELANLMAQSKMIPKDFQGQPGDVLVAVQMGAEVGMAPVQSLQNIAVINGRPSIWGDAVLALVKNHSKFEYIDETFDQASMTATCRIKRKNEPEQVRTFSQADAQTAKLWGKQGPWQTNPKRMLQMRARGFACRDVFPDALKGLSVAEEVQDMVDINEAPTGNYTKPAGEANTINYLPESQFNEQFPRWEKAIENGMKAPEEVIEYVTGKGFTLTDEQSDKILSVEVPQEGEV
jgi:hypothetical protein